MERNKKEARDYICQSSNKVQFEIDHSHEPRRVVDLEAKACGCGRWQLNGIPCPQVVCAIYINRCYFEDYISKWYLMDTYKLSYALVVILNLILIAIVDPNPKKEKIIK
jgi:hypothetical protein